MSHKLGGKTTLFYVISSHLLFVTIIVELNATITYQQLRLFYIPVRVYNLLSLHRSASPSSMENCTNCTVCIILFWGGFFFLSSKYRQVPPVLLIKEKGNEGSLSQQQVTDKYLHQHTVQFIEVNSDPKGRIGVLMLHHTYAGPSASCAGPIANSLCNPGHADMPMCMQQNSRHEYPAMSLTAILCQCFWENNFINIYMCVCEYIYIYLMYIYISIYIYIYIHIFSHCLYPLLFRSYYHHFGAVMFSSSPPQTAFQTIRLSQHKIPN